MFDSSFSVFLLFSIPNPSYTDESNCDITVTNNDSEIVYTIKGTEHPFKYIKFNTPHPLKAIKLFETSRNSGLNAFISWHSFSLYSNDFCEIFHHTT